MAAYLIICTGIAGLIGGLYLTSVGVVALARHRGGWRFAKTPPAAIPTITLEGKGQFHVEPGVLLNTLWEHLPDAACQSGECGGCKLRLLSGEVAWIREPTVSVDRRTHILACSCEARGPIHCSAP